MLTFAHRSSGTYPRAAAVALALLASASCTPPALPVDDVRSTLPSGTTTVTVAPEPTAPLDSGWSDLRPGLQSRMIRPRVAQTGGRVMILRVDPQLWRLDVHYSPGAPRLLETWQADTGADVVVNAGYYTPEGHATGLIVAQGEEHGSSYGEFAGMLTVDDAGRPNLRWLREQPYIAGEPLWGAIQSFPLLLRPDGEHGFPEEDGRAARRTVVALDNEDRLLFAIAPDGGFTLHGLARWLSESDLDLRIALNLDGGTSTGLLVAGAAEASWPAFVSIPAVLTLDPR